MVPAGKRGSPASPGRAKEKNTELAKERDSLKTEADQLRKSKQELEQDVGEKKLRTRSSKKVPIGKGTKR